PALHHVDDQVPLVYPEIVELPARRNPGTQSETPALAFGDLVPVGRSSPRGRGHCALLPDGLRRPLLRRRAVLRWALLAALHRAAEEALIGNRLAGLRAHARRHELHLLMLWANPVTHRTLRFSVEVNARLARGTGIPAETTFAPGDAGSWTGTPRTARQLDCSRISSPCLMS